MRKLMIVFALLFCTACSSTIEKKASDMYAIFGYDSVSDKGVYHVVNTDYGSAAYFFDINSKKDVPLCAKADCSMENKNNDAYTLMKYKDNTVLRLPPVYYEGNLYFFYEDYAVGTIYLCKSKEDGTDRQEIIKLPKGAIAGAMFYDHKLYMSIQTMVFDPKNEQAKPKEEVMGYIFDLSTKKMKEFKIPKDYNILFTGVVNHKVYLEEFNTVSFTNMKTSILDEDNLTLHETLNSGKETSYIHDNKLYFGKDMVIKSIDVHTKKESDIMKITNDMYKVNAYNNDPSGIMTVVYIEKKGENPKEMYIDVDMKKEIHTNKKVVMKLHGKYLVEDEKGMLSFLK